MLAEVVRIVLDFGRHGLPRRFPELADVDAKKLADTGQISLDVEATDAPVSRVALVAAVSSGPGLDAAAGRDRVPREVGGVPVRFDPGDAAVVDAFARGAHAPLDAWHPQSMGPRDRPHAGLRRAGLTPVPYEHPLAAVKTVLNRLRGRALPGRRRRARQDGRGGHRAVRATVPRLARRVLVLVPPGLVTQSREESRHKFGLDFVTHDAEAFRQQGPAAWKRFERVVASFHTAKRAEHAWTAQPIWTSPMVVKMRLFEAI